jgi:hypothetical protein
MKGARHKAQGTRREKREKRERREREEQKAAVATGHPFDTLRASS